MFRVRWKRSALDEMAGLWLPADAEQRLTLARAAQEVTEQLQIQADTKGEARPNNRRVVFVHHLGVLYRVDVGRSLVRILQVWSS
jgi:hypothetical protein